MLETHQRIYPKHTVVGWFSTGMAAGIADGIIHQFYSTGQQSGCGIPVPMYLVVDTSLAQSDRVSIKAYVCKVLTLSGSPVAREFVEVPTQIQTSGGEGLALSALRQEKLDSMPSDVQNFRQSVSKLQSLIAQAHAYVKEVVDGKRPMDVTIGRCVPDLRASSPSCIWFVAARSTLRYGTWPCSVRHKGSCKHISESPQILCSVHTVDHIPVSVLLARTRG